MTGRTEAVVANVTKDGRTRIPQRVFDVLGIRRGDSLMFFPRTNSRGEHYALVVPLRTRLEPDVIERMIQELGEDTSPQRSTL